MCMQREKRQVFEAGIVKPRFPVHLARFAAPEEMHAHSGQRGMCYWWMENGWIVTPERQVVEKGGRVE